MSLNLKLLCTTCQSEFEINLHTYKALGLHNLPKRCPKCNDERQNRPGHAITEHRQLIAEFYNVQISLPKRIMELFKPYRAQQKDRECLRAVLKGDLGQGVSWDGRLDVYSLSNFLPQLAYVRVMRVKNEEGISRKEKRRIPGTFGIKEETEVKYSNTYEYMVIEQMPETAKTLCPTSALIFASVDYKTTLQGLGRQYYASLDSSEALWAKEFSSQCRSGRFGTKMTLAIVNDDHSVFTSQSGDVKSHIRYSLSHPNGERDYTPVTIE